MRLRVVVETDPMGLVRLQQGGFEVEEVGVAPGWLRRHRSAEATERAPVPVATEIPQAGAASVATREESDVGEPDRSNPIGGGLPDPARADGSGAPPATWRTAERRAVLVRDWPTDRPKGVIVAEMAALPGLPVKKGHLSVWAAQLKLRRPESALSAKERALRAQTVARLAATKKDATASGQAILDTSAPARVEAARVEAAPVRVGTVPLQGVPRGPVPRLPAAGFDGKVRASFEEIKAWAAYYGIAYDGGNMDVVNRRRVLNGQPQIVQEGP